MNQSIDPIDPWTQYLLSNTFSWNNQARLDVALDYIRAGLCAEAAELCQCAEFAAIDGTGPVLSYLLGFLFNQLGEKESSQYWLQKARSEPAAYCFPSRLEEMQFLEWAAQLNKSDDRARYYLGNFYYHHRRYEDAIRAWEASVIGASPVPASWRNLGIAYFNVKHDTARARDAFDRAFALSPEDSRVFFERDQLWKRAGAASSERLAQFELHHALVVSRDDLSLELIALRNQSRQHIEADKLLKRRTFQPWEGGEGLVLEQHVRTKVALGRLALMDNDEARAFDHFLTALDSPPNLGEASHLLANRSNVHFWLGVACERLGQNAEAKAWWERAAAANKDFRDMHVQSFSAMSLYRALSLQRLGKDEEADKLLRALQSYAGTLEATEAKVDYFATSLPNTLLFREDLRQKQWQAAQLLLAQGLLGAGDFEESGQKLEGILARDPANGAASDLLEESETLAELSLLRQGSTRTGDSRN